MSGSSYLKHVHLGFTCPQNVIGNMGVCFTYFLECSQWFAPYCKPFVFTLMKESLD